MLHDVASRSNNYNLRIEISQLRFRKNPRRHIDIDRLILDPRDHGQIKMLMLCSRHIYIYTYVYNALNVVMESIDVYT